MVNFREIEEGEPLLFRDRRNNEVYSRERNICRVRRDGAPRCRIRRWQAPDCTPRTVVVSSGRRVRQHPDLPRRPWPARRDHWSTAIRWRRRFIRWSKG